MRHIPFEHHVTIVDNKIDHQPPNMTWDRLAVGTHPNDINNLAIVTCGNGHMSKIIGNVHKIADDGIVSPQFFCPEDKCTFRAEIQLLDWKLPAPLHCVVWEKIKIRDRKVIVIPMKDYFRAIDDANCRAQFLAANPNLNLGLNGNARIVGIAPVIGYHAMDDNADKVSV